MSERKLNKHLSISDNGTNVELTWTPILLTDSKGKYIRPHTQPNTTGSHIIWHHQGGRTSEDCGHWVEHNKDQLLKRHGKVHIYIWVGTCDLTHKPGKFIFLKPDQKNLVKAIKHNLNKLKERSETGKVTVSFLQIPYYTIENHNAIKGHKTPEQFREDDVTLKKSIDELNTYIDTSNCEQNSSSPKFNQDMQKSRTRRGRTTYSTNFKLLTDGVHPGESLAKVWLKHIESKIARECN
ncbi:MAG: hypothetical protein ABW168_21960 [Sedimenticola sp.]